MLWLLLVLALFLLLPLLDVLLSSFVDTPRSRPRLALSPCLWVDCTAAARDGLATLPPLPSPPLAPPPRFRLRLPPSSCLASPLIPNPAAEYPEDARRLLGASPFLFSFWMLLRCALEEEAGVDEDADDPKKLSIPNFWLRTTRKGTSERSFPSAMQRLSQSAQECCSDRERGGVWGGSADGRV